ncbi:DctP family TRAP transporter solute-binding subunit [Succinivibrio dextrinosolvens]|uniref:Tripartite ATP-independent transporter solute receptor, DctP family n=1 Tax=Succinivibrio dextrinosolvens TaxID=83771 RepID=A0A662ZBH3_9GAMM|nr:DctP family TRAP transporter solute-binding subunit [Succinivibrio dextrinosolvens]SFK09827.1 tripartite ATP-independent transporter solute receptor, DctP family [Succinivibrio dextrinosolvens]
MKKILATLVASALVFGSISGAEAATKKVTISVPDPNTSYIYAAAQEFASRANKYSDGTLEFSISGNGSLYGGDTAAGIKQLGAGSLQMVILASSVYTNFVPALNVISVPYMFDDQAQLLKFLNSDIATELFNRVNKMNITVAGKWTRSFREVTNSQRPITKPEDLKGIVLRVPNNSLYVEFFKACGAVTTPMNFSEVYNALQLHTLDGQENPVDVPYSNKFYEVQKYISFTNHMADAWLVGINSKFFDKLDDKQKEAILKAGAEVQQWNVDMMAEQDKVALKSLTDNGMTANELTPEAQKAFVEVSKSCYPKFRALIKDDALFDKTAEFTGRK